MGYQPKLTWTRRATGYYESVSVAGTPLLIQLTGKCWSLFAGNKTAARGSYGTLIDAKIAADRMFA